MLRPFYSAWSLLSCLAHLGLVCACGDSEPSGGNTGAAGSPTDSGVGGEAEGSGGAGGAADDDGEGSGAGSSLGGESGGRDAVDPAPVDPAPTGHPAVTSPQGDVFAGPNPVMIQIEVKGAAVDVNLGMDAEVVGSFDEEGRFSLDVTEVPEGDHELTLELDGQVYDSGIFLHVDHTAPTLLASLPAHADGQVSRAAPIELTYSELVHLDGQPSLSLLESGVELPAVATSQGEKVTFLAEEAFPAPSRVRVKVGAEVLDRAGNPAEPATLEFGVPVWKSLGPEVSTSGNILDLQIALDNQGRVKLLLLDGEELRALHWTDEEWQILGEVLNDSAVLGGLGLPRATFAAGPGGQLLAAWRELSGIVVKRLIDNVWESLGPLEGASEYGALSLAVAFDVEGDPLLAFDAQSLSAEPELRVEQFKNDAWTSLGVVPSVAAPSLALVGGATPHLAYTTSSSNEGIFVASWDGTTFVDLALPAPGILASDLDLAITQEGVALTATGAGTWLLGAEGWRTPAQTDFGILNSSRAVERSLASEPSGRLWAAFQETLPGALGSKVYVQRSGGEHFQPMGPALNQEEASAASRPGLVVDAEGHPIIAWIEKNSDGDARVHVARYNADPDAVLDGLRPSAPTEGCLDPAPEDGSLLSESGCTAGDNGRELVEGFLPFSVKSPLWTDGAYKRRYLMLPNEDATIGYTETGSWQLPAGTILAKEFALARHQGDPSTILPVETRFLVVRDDGNWERYNYEWNQEGTVAVLRENNPADKTTSFQILDEGGQEFGKTHFYPGRGDCLQCHEKPGQALGLQTAQMNRNVEYASTVDNQIRAMNAVGLFGDTYEAGGQLWMPYPQDTTYDLEARLRSSLHANCSSCHYPLFGLDLRWETPTFVDGGDDTGLCAKIVRGDLETSVLYWRDVLRRDMGEPSQAAAMPPLGTLENNPDLDLLVTEWIQDADNVCP